MHCDVGDAEGQTGREQASSPEIAPEPGRFLSQSAVLTLCNGTSAVLALFYVAETGRILGPAEYGTVAAALSLGHFFSLVLGPLESGVCKAAAAYHGRGDRGHLAAMVYGGLRALMLPLGAGLVGWLVIAPWLGSWLQLRGGTVLGWLTAFFALWVLACVPRGVLRGDQRFFAYGINQVCESIARLACGLIALHWGLQAGGALAGYTVGIGFGLALALWQVRAFRHAPRIKLDVQGLFAFSGPLFMVYLYFMFLVNADMLAAKSALSEVEAGLYGGASTLARLLYVGLAPTFQVLFSHVAAARARHEVPARLLKRVLGSLAVGLLLSFGIPLFLGSEVLRIVFGPAYAEGAMVLGIMWLTSSLLVLQAAVAFVLLGLDRSEGFWLLLLPCVGLGILLVVFHGSMMQIALCSLAAVVNGWIVLALLILVPLVRRGGTVRA